MKKIDLINATKGFQKTLVKRQPELLVALGIAGMVSAMVADLAAQLSGSLPSVSVTIITPSPAVSATITLRIIAFCPLASPSSMSIAVCAYRLSKAN